MNCFDAKAEWINGAWRAMVRYVHRGEFWPVMDGDQPAGFQTSTDAELAAHRALTKHMNSTIRVSADKEDQAAEERERVFGPASSSTIFPGKGRPPVTLETKRRPGV